MMRTRRFNIDNISAASRRGLDPIKLAYNPCQLDGRLLLTATAFNRCQQFWPLDTLHHHYLLHHSQRDGQAEWACINRGMVYQPQVVTNTSTNWVRRSWTLLLWLALLPLRQTDITGLLTIWFDVYKVFKCVILVRNFISRLFHPVHRHCCRGKF